MLARALGDATTQPGLRLARQRLVEWLEDLRSVGGHEELAKAIEVQVARLATALDQSDIVRAVVVELTKLATPSMTTTGRPAFWK